MADDTTSRSAMEVIVGQVLEFETMHKASSSSAFDAAVPAVASSASAVTHRVIRSPADLPPALPILHVLLQRSAVISFTFSISCSKDFDMISKAILLLLRNNWLRLFALSLNLVLQNSSNLSPPKTSLFFVFSMSCICYLSCASIAPDCLVFQACSTDSWNLWFMWKFSSMPWCCKYSRRISAASCRDLYAHSGRPDLFCIYSLLLLFSFLSFCFPLFFCWKDSVDATFRLFHFLLVENRTALASSLRNLPLFLFSSCNDPRILELTNSVRTVQQNQPVRLTDQLRQVLSLIDHPDDLVRQQVLTHLRDLSRSPSLTAQMEEIAAPDSQVCHSFIFVTFAFFYSLLTLRFCPVCQHCISSGFGTFGALSRSKYWCPCWDSDDSLGRFQLWSSRFLAVFVQLRIFAAQCLGVLGALDPARINRTLLSYYQARNVTQPSLGISNEQLACQLIESFLFPTLKAANLNIDRALCAIQVGIACFFSFFNLIPSLLLHSSSLFFSWLIGAACIFSLLHCRKLLIISSVLRRVYAIGTCCWVFSFSSSRYPKLASFISVSWFNCLLHHF